MICVVIDVEAGERSAWLECAVSISLLMFGALLERCCALLPEPHHTQHHADALLLLPAIKVSPTLPYKEATLVFTDTAGNGFCGLSVIGLRSCLSGPRS